MERCPCRPSPHPLQEWVWAPSGRVLVSNQGGLPVSKALRPPSRQEGPLAAYTQTGGSTTRALGLFPFPPRHSHSEATLSRLLYRNTSLKVVYEKGKTNQW